jgi:hypothetical protein
MSGGSYYIKWSERVIVIPVRAAGTYYNIDCPTSAITITRFPELIQPLTLHTDFQ